METKLCQISPTSPDLFCMVLENDNAINIHLIDYAKEQYFSLISQHCNLELSVVGSFYCCLGESINLHINIFCSHRTSIVNDYNALFDIELQCQTLNRVHCLARYTVARINRCDLRMLET